MAELSVELTGRLDADSDGELSEIAEGLKWLHKYVKAGNKVVHSASTLASKYEAYDAAKSVQRQILCYNKDAKEIYYDVDPVEDEPEPTPAAGGAAEAPAAAAPAAGAAAPAAGAAGTAGKS